jgi:hypothetical protein
MKGLIVLNPQPTPTCIDWVGHPEEVTVVRTWPEVLELLRKDYPGAARVGVIQDGTVQYIRKDVSGSQGTPYGDTVHSTERWVRGSLGMRSSR